MPVAVPKEEEIKKGDEPISKEEYNKLKGMWIQAKSSKRDNPFTGTLDEYIAQIEVLNHSVS